MTEWICADCGKTLQGKVPAVRMYFAFRKPTEYLCSACYEHNQENKAPMTKPIRQRILENAIQYTTQDRNQTHGDPVAQHTTLARFWTTYLQARGLLPPGVELENTDAAWMMGMVKPSRYAHGDRQNPDNFADASAYPAIAGECAGVQP